MSLFFSRDFACVLPLENTLILARTRRELKGASDVSFGCILHRGKLKTLLQRVCRADVGVFKISLES